MVTMMRVNLARPSRGISGDFFDSTVRSFSEEYDFVSIKAAINYVKNGRQGLQAFVYYLINQGYKAEIYSLDPNKDLFRDVGDEWQLISRSSPSYGFVIADDDPQLVEFKLKNG